MSDHTDHFVLICSTCQSSLPAHSVQHELARKLPVGFTTRLVSCMAGCERPMTIGFQAADKAQYLFGDIEDHSDLAALAAFAQQYLDSEDGWTNATDRPMALYTKTLSRMPALPGRGAA